MKGVHFINGLFPDTSKPPASVFCDHFSDKEGTLSSPRIICTTPYLDSNDFTT